MKNDGWILFEDDNSISSIIKVNSIDAFRTYKENLNWVLQILAGNSLLNFNYSTEETLREAVQIVKRGVGILE